MLDSEELEQIKAYLTDMVNRGDDGAKNILKMLSDRPEERDVKSIHFHREMEPTEKIEVFTHTVNGELIKGVSIAMYSPEPETDWCVELSVDDAVKMAQKIIHIYGG